MDDLTPEIRIVVEAARAPDLSRAHKARLWARLEARLAEPVHARPATDRGRWPFVLPAFARHALAGACVLALALGAEAPGTSVEPRPHAVAAARVHAPAPVKAPGTPVANASLMGERSATATLPKRRSNARRALAPAAPQPEAAPGAADHVLALGAAPFPEEEASQRVRPARTRLLAVKTSPLTPRLPSPQVSADFRDKLIAENLARYQAAIAEHARIASIRRPLPSVGGYAAW